MKLKVKDIGLSTGGPLIAVLDEEDARKFDLHNLDRIRISSKKNSTIAAINISEHNTSLKEGEIGLFEELIKKLRAKNNEDVEIKIAKTPTCISSIRRKLKGEKLSEEEIYCIIRDINNNKLSSVELTYFVAGCYSNGLDMNETVYLTRAISESGKKLSLKKKVIVDKHCIGGIPNNRTSMIIVPIIATAGLTIPKTSSRAITSASGTADVMETLANVSLSMEKVKKVIRKTNACMIWGGTIDLASADDKLIKIEYPLSLDPWPILLASVVSKNLAVGSTHILIDIPYGVGAKITTKEDAKKLRKKFKELCSRLKIKTKVILTDGSQPIGNGIGPLLEARDVMVILKREANRPLDLEKKSVKMADIILKMAGSKEKAIDILNSGRAYKKMLEIIKAQGAKKDLKLAKYWQDIEASKTGKIVLIKNKEIAKIARIAGAPKNKKAGVYLNVHVNSKINKGDILLRVYSENRSKLKFAIDTYKMLKPIKSG